MPEKWTKIKLICLCDWTIVSFVFNNLRSIRIRIGEDMDMDMTVRRIRNWGFNLSWIDSHVTIQWLMFHTCCGKVKCTLKAKIENVFTNFWLLLRFREKKRNGFDQSMENERNRQKKNGWRWYKIFWIFQNARKFHSIYKLEIHPKKQDKYAGTKPSPH